MQNQNSTVFAEARGPSASNMIPLRHSTHPCHSLGMTEYVCVCAHTHTHTHAPNGKPAKALRQSKALHHKVATVGPFEKHHHPGAPMLSPHKDGSSSGVWSWGDTGSVRTLREHASPLQQLASHGDVVRPHPARRSGDARQPLPQV